MLTALFNHTEVMLFRTQLIIVPHAASSILADVSEKALFPHILARDHVRGT